VFAAELLLWFVTSFSLVTLACSTLFVIYFCVRTTLETLFAALLPEPHGAARRPTAWNVELTSPKARPIVAAVDKSARRQSTEIAALNVGAIAGPWGPIDRGLSPETAQKIERVMAIGLGMRDAAGNPCPHPIAPRVALAIVEALQ
jgi:hypothetical protein